MVFQGGHGEELVLRREGQGGWYWAQGHLLQGEGWGLPRIHHWPSPGRLGLQVTCGNLEGIMEDLGVTRKDPGGTKEDLEGTKKDLEGTWEYLGVTREDPGRTNEDLESTRKYLEGTWEDLERTRGGLEESAKETQEDLVVFWASALAEHRPGFLESVSEEGRAAQRVGGICWAVQRKVSFKVEP